jgi:hypothetical protein
MNCDDRPAKQGSVMNQPSASAASARSRRGAAVEWFQP